MSGVRISLDQNEDVLAELGAALKRVENPRGLFDQLGAALVSSTQHRFETETDPAGNPWPESLRKQLVGGRTLTMTAALVQSITHEATDSSVAVGTNVIYAAIHQMGGTIKAKTPQGLRFRGAGNSGWVRKDEVTIPARPFLGVDKDDESMISRIVTDWVLGIEN